MPSWRSTRTASSSRMRVQTTAATWAPTCRRSPRASRRSCTRRCSPASTRRRRSTCEVTAVFTNTAPVDAYRGAGRPEATYVVERLVARRGCGAGHRAGRDRAGATSSARSRTRRRWRCTYDTGDYDACARRGDEDRRRRRASPRARPRRPSAASCAASATRRTSRPAASRRRTSPARSARAPGCSRPARCACIRPAASRCSPARTATARDTRRHSRRSSRAGSASRSRTSTIVHGDTGRVPFGMGTYGSRSLAVGGTAIVKALDKVDRQGQEDRRAPARGGRSRHRVRATASSPSPAPTAARPSARSR